MTIAGAAAALTEKTRTGEVRVETVSTFQAFLDLEPAWNELVETTGIDHPFLEHTWIRTWWECFGAGSDLHILVVKEDDEIIAIAPLISTRIRMFGIQVRRLGFFHNAHVPRADFLIARRAEDVYRAIWDQLLATRGSWDLLQLCQVSEGSDTVKEVKKLASQGGHPTGVWLSGESPFVSLDSTFEEYYTSLPSKHRSNLRNRMKRLSVMGPVVLETVTRPGAVPEALEAGFRLEEAAWKQQAGTAISCDPNVQKFYEAFGSRAAEQNWLRLNFLGVGGTRIAFDYSLAYRDQIFLLKNGYDPGSSAYSPSNLLVSMVLESVFKEGLTKYDFLGEASAWKSCWAKESRPNYWLFVFSTSFKGRCLHCLKFQVIPWMKSVMAPRKKEASV
jgi:CelD/BcsL family acetyltransferase involved in cellulose biosynthesis